MKKTGINAMRFISKNSYFWRETTNAKLMKKIGLITLAIITSLSGFSQNDSTAISPATTASMQNDHSPKFRMGLSGSGVLSWINPDADEAVANGDGTRFNIQYGLHLDFRLGANENYYFSTGLFLMNTGGTLVHQGSLVEDNSEDAFVPGTVTTIDHRINYLNIPLTMMLRTKEIGYVTYFARVGADAGINISSSYDVSEAEPGEPTQTREDVSDNLAGLFRAALHIEAGIEYNISGSTRLFASLEWNDGLNNIFTDDYQIQTSETQTRRIKANTDALLLNVGIYF
jgi:hypothetical protein